MEWIKLLAVLFCMIAAGAGILYLKSFLPETKQKLEKVNYGIAMAGVVVCAIALIYKIVTY